MVAFYFQAALDGTSSRLNTVQTHLGNSWLPPTPPLLLRSRHLHRYLRTMHSVSHRGDQKQNREGRLLRRFLTMAQAKKSPAASSAAVRPRRPAARHIEPDPKSGPAAGLGARVGHIAGAAVGAFSALRARARGGASGHNASGQAAGEASSAGADRAANGGAVGRGASGGPGSSSAGAGPARTTRWWSAAAAAAAVETAAGETGAGGSGGKGPEVEVEEEDWDGSVGPQVVKAFINYFSKEVGVWGEGVLYLPLVSSAP